MSDTSKELAARVEPRPEAFTAQEVATIEQVEIAVAELSRGMHNPRSVEDRKPAAETARELSTLFAELAKALDGEGGPR